MQICETRAHVYIIVVRTCPLMQNERALVARAFNYKAKIMKVRAHQAAMGMLSQWK